MEQKPTIGQRKWRIIDPNQFPKAFTNIAYCNESPEQLMDVYLPEQEGVWPVVVLVHGGGFISGSRKVEHFATMFKIISKGYAVATIDYRLAPNTQFPKQIHDVKAAIRYLRAHADELQVDTSRLVVWGNSAGAYLVAMAGCKGDYPLLQDLSMGNANESAEVDGVIAWYGGYDYSDVSRIASMMLGDYVNDTEKACTFTYINENYPPILIQHGKKDRLVDWQQSQQLYDVITERCGEGRAILEYFENADHGGPEIKCDDNIDRCVAFLDSIYFADRPCTYARKPYTEITFIDDDDVRGDNYEQ